MAEAKPKKRPGRPKRKFGAKERQQIQRYVGMGLTTAEVARLMRTTAETLRREARDLIPSRAGRPPVSLEPSEEQRQMVEAMRGMALTEDEISTIMRVSVTELRALFEEEMRRGAPVANATVAGRLYAAAVAGDVRAMIFWLQCRAGWKTSVTIDGHVDHAHLHAVDVNATVREAVGKLDREGRDALRLAMAKIAGRDDAAAEEAPATVH